MEINYRELKVVFIMKVALYIRVSTKEQAREGLSLAAQEDLLRKYCKLYEYTVYGVYCDDGYSAKNTKRPALERLFTDIENHLFDAVIVWKLTRISRNTIDLLKMISFFEKNGVHFVSYSEQFDTGTPVGKLMITLLASIAEFERETISDNVKTALRYRAEKGEPTATQILGYNRKDGFLYINHKEALLVQLIFKEYIKCFNYTEVARRMNKKGYCGKRGKPFRAHQIRIIITNATYCGYNLWERKIIKSHHAPIIKRELLIERIKEKYTLIKDWLPAAICSL